MGPKQSESARRICIFGARLSHGQTRAPAKRKTIDTLWIGKPAFSKCMTLPYSTKWSLQNSREGWRLFWTFAAATASMTFPIMLANR